MTTVSRSQVATARDAGDGLAVGRQVFRSHLVQTSEHLQLVGRLPRSANQKAAAIIDSSRDERMNECSDSVVIQRTLDAARLS